MSNHFAKGTFVTEYVRGRGLVIERWANAYTVEWEETDEIETFYLTQPNKVKPV